MNAYNKDIVHVLNRLSGYLFRKVSRTAAFVVGCTFLALQVSTCIYALISYVYLYMYIVTSHVQT